MVYSSADVKGSIQLAETDRSRNEGDPERPGCTHVFYLTSHIPRVALLSHEGREEDSTIGLGRNWYRRALQLN